MKTINKKCRICEDIPKDIWQGFLATCGVYLCISCMKKHGNTHNEKIGNYIPTDYFNLTGNRFKTL